MSTAVRNAVSTWRLIAAVLAVVIVFLSVGLLNGRERTRERSIGERPVVGGFFDRWRNWRHRHDPQPQPQPEPQPQPKPEPKPPIPPTPQPIPIPDAGLVVVLVYESDHLDNMPLDQSAILTAKAVRDYLAAKCAKDDKGRPQFRFLDKDSDTSKQSPQIQAAFSRATGKPTPWIVIAGPKESFEGPLPATVKDTTELLTKFGG